MPMIKTITVDAAAASITTPWVGNQYEYLPFDAQVEIALLADAADTFNAAVFSGTDVLMQNSQIDTLAIATPITYPDDYSLDDVAAAGERLGCQLTNGTGAVATVRTAVRITPA